MHLDLVVPDVEAARARALAAGATAEGDISDHVWGRMARLADPFGHGVCLIEFRGRGYDALCEGAMCEGATQGATDACSSGT